MLCSGRTVFILAKSNKLMEYLIHYFLSISNY
jgi:hypothetical protein